MLNRYRHLLKVNPVGATSFEPVLLHRLRYIDLRINGTLAMLRDFPEIEKSIRASASKKISLKKKIFKILVNFWNSYRRENTPETNQMSSFEYIGDDKNNENLIRLYKQTYERNHPGNQIQQAFSKVKSEITNEENKITSPVIFPKTSVKPEREDSDEDQFDDDDEESNDGYKKSNEKIFKEKPYRIQFEQKPKEVIKQKQTKPEPPKKEIKPNKDENIDDEEEEDDDEDDEDDNGKVYFEINDKKNGKKAETLNVAIEPIVSDQIEEEMNEIQPAYAKHDPLIVYNVNKI